MIKRKEINRELLSLALTVYDLKTDGFYWKDGVKPRGRMPAGFPRAGNINNRGYRYLCVKDKMYLEHRIVFFAHHGYVPDVIDHINRIKTDNRVENLRESSQVHNMLNADKRRNNTSGVRGVTWDKAKNKWKAQISVKYKVMNLGCFESLDDAKAAYERANELAMSAAAQL